MLSVPSPQRSVGLPSSPRPNRAPSSAKNNPYSTGSQLPTASPARSRPERPAPIPSSSHTRSRSQPPRPSLSSAQNRPPPFPTRSSNGEDTGAVSTSHDRERSRPRFTSRANQEERQFSGKSARRSISPHSLSRSPTPEAAASSAKVNESYGDGHAIWNAVSTVASALTISVSKAWKSNITTFAGEETPPGQESRLTQAMKAYHIAKARDTSDLPDWLFDERERRGADVQALPDDTDNHQAQVSTRRSDGASTTTPPERWKSAPPSREPAPSQPRGTDRLKAMRDAKRNARDADVRANDNGQPLYLQETPQPGPRQPRIGLPSGPQRGRR